MTGVPGQRDLFSLPSQDDSAVVADGRCMIRTQRGHRVVIASGLVLAQPAVGDRPVEAHAMVGLVEQGWADRTDVTRA